MMVHKVIQDSVFGGIRVEGYVLELLETLEMQRLNAIRQLGLTYLVFPGANHTRIEHSLGSCYIAGRIAKALHLPIEERNHLLAAALLHDIGHGPFSHTLERSLSSFSYAGHMGLTKKVITGESQMVREEDRKTFPDVPTIPDVLEKYEINPERVSNLVMGSRGMGVEPLFQPHVAFAGEKKYLPQLIHGVIDVDQIDYLMRDAHYTGVAHGIVDLDRLVETSRIVDDELVFEKKGVSAVEGLFVARALMFSSVYFHKTVRIAELMLARAVEHAQDADAEAIQRMVDSELMAWLHNRGGLQEEIGRRIKYRKLYKKVWVKSVSELNEQEKECLSALVDEKKRRRKEDSICRRAGIPEGMAIIDLPRPELLVTEPRLRKTDLKILDNGKVKRLSKASSLSRTLRTRDVSDWIAMVSANPRYREEVARVAEKALFS